MARDYHYLIDAEGRVFHDGTEIVDPATLRFFMLAMTRTPDGRWLVPCQGEANWFEVRETPFVVQRLEVVPGEGGATAIELHLAGGHRERLDPSTLGVDGGHLVCRVRRAYVARFGRVALQQLAPLLHEEGGAVELRLGGRAHRIGDARVGLPPGAGLSARDRRS